MHWLKFKVHAKTSDLSMVAPLLVHLNFVVERLLVESLIYQLVSFDFWRLSRSSGFAANVFRITCNSIVFADNPMRFL